METLPPAATAKAATNGAAIGLGIASLVFGILGALTSWIPFIGCFSSVPFLVIGLILGGIGLFMSISTGGKSIGLPLAGVITCIVAGLIWALVTFLILAASQAHQKQQNMQYPSLPSPPRHVQHMPPSLRLCADTLC